MARKNSATRRDFPALTRFELAIPWRVLALTVRILLLLAGLLPAALLLLTGLLAPDSGSAGPGSDSGSTSKSPLLNRSKSELRALRLVAAKAGSAGIIAWQDLVASAAAEPVLPTT
jgi:hypothetical protein